MFSLLVIAAALGQDPCGIVCTEPEMFPGECAILVEQCQNDVAEEAARAAPPAFPERVEILNTALTEPPSDQVVPWEDPAGNIHIPEGPYGPIESLRDQGASGFDQPGPLVLEVPADWTVDQDTIYIPIPEVSPPAPVEEPPPE